MYEDIIFSLEKFRQILFKKKLSQKYFYNHFVQLKNFTVAHEWQFGISNIDFHQPLI
jgi:hypothetical protein